MIKALVDPSLLTPPAQGSCRPWLKLLRLWSQALRDLNSEAITPVMSPGAQAGLATTGSRAVIQAALDRSGSPVGASDVLQIVESIRGRTSTPAEVFQPSDIGFDAIELSPDYVDSGADELVEPFRQDLGHGAVLQQETTSRVAVITVEAAWRNPADAVAVTSEVEVWEKFGVVEEPDAEAASVSEFIDLWCQPGGLDTTLVRCWPSLIEYPDLGIEFAYRAFTSKLQGDTHPLKFKIGSQLVSTMKTAGYTGQVGRIKSVCKASAYIGCQRARDLPSLKTRSYRKSVGANSEAVERADGAKLMRGSLGTGPNAHRLMWWDGPVPEILGVVGHDDDPLFLI